MVRANMFKQIQGVWTDFYQYLNFTGFVSRAVWYSGLLWQTGRLSEHCPNIYNRQNHDIQDN